MFYRNYVPGSVYIPEQTTLSEDTYVLELEASFSCSGKETSFLCVSVFDVVIGETTTLSPICYLGKADYEPLQFLIPDATREQMCTALPLLDYNDPGAIVVAILQLQFTLDRSMFPFIFRIFAHNQTDVVTFLYSHCGLQPPTTPTIMTTESAAQTVQPTIICLQVENNTITFPASVNIGNENLRFSTFDNLNITCEEMSAQETNDNQNASNGAVCVSWSTSDVSIEVVVSDDAQIALMQKVS